MAAGIQVEQQDSSSTPRDKRVVWLIALVTLVVLYLFINSRFSPYWRHTEADVTRIISQQELVGQPLAAVEQKLRTVRLDHGDSLVVTGFDAATNTLSAEIPKAHHYFMIPQSIWVRVKFSPEGVAQSYEVTGYVETAL